MTPEGKVKAKIRAFLKSRGERCWYCQPIGSAYSGGGIPDIVGVYRRVGFAIEVKAPGREKTVTPLQEMALSRVQAAGGVAFVASDVGVVVDMFHAIDALQDGRL